MLSGVEEEWAAEQRHAARRLALIAEIDARGVAVAAGASSTAVWLRHRLSVDAAVARQMVVSARGLAKSLPATAKALADAEINEGQARVINHAVGELPGEVGPGLRDEAERVLIGHAGQFAPSALATKNPSSRALVGRGSDVGGQRSDVVSSASSVDP